MFLDGGVQVDELLGQLNRSGSAVTVNRTLRCYDGYELSCETVGDITVEARRGGAGAYTDIEATPIDVSADAGTDQSYQFRFTPGSVAGVRAFRIRLGPPEVTVTYNLTGGGDALVGDGSVLTS